MTKARAGTVVALLLIALSGLNTYFILRGKQENGRRAAENHALALGNCRNLAELAKVERAFIEQQEQQTTRLLEGGITFGIPKALLPRLLAQNEHTQATFLAGLDKLTVLNCAPGRFLTAALEGVRPGKEPLGLAGRARLAASALQP
jgi:hypothetical protein